MGCDPFPTMKTNKENNNYTDLWHVEKGCILLFP